MHHDICDGAIGESFGVEFWMPVVLGGVGEFATEEDSGVAVHGGLGWDRGVELPHDDGFGVVDEVFPDTRKIVDDGDVEVSELLGGANSGEEHETARIDCASAEDGFGFR